jgi:protein SCO1/2
MKLCNLLLPLLLLLLPPPARLAFAAPAPALAGIAFEQKPGARLPRQDLYRDDTGRMVRLDELFEGMPLVLVLGYFHCRNLCSVVRGDLLKALTASGLVAGRDYSLAALSIDPSEGSNDAAAAKAEDLKRFPAPGAVRNWHFLTGTPESVQDLASAAGFHDRSDPERKTFAHPVGVVFATPGGVISSYLPGVGYRAGDVRLAVMRAMTGSIASPASPILLLCSDFDPTTGRYTLAIMKILRLAAAITVLMAAGIIFFAIRRERHRA